MQLAHPFIQLPLLFDAERLLAEVTAMGADAWREHPQKFPGNSMLPLVAADGDPANESFAGAMRATPHLDGAPYLRQTLGALGVTLGRTRLMRLSGGAEVKKHADQGYYWIDRTRVHVPIVTQPGVRFECGDAATHMGAGECWIFDTWRQHRVLNDSSEERIHLVVDTVGGEAFWQLVAAGRPHARGGGEWSARFIAPNPTAAPDLAFETVNVPNVMSPWEIEAHLSFIFREAGRHPQIPPIARASSRFTRDWRALWARFGADAEGYTHYRKRLAAFVQEVQAPAREIGLSNGVPMLSAIMTMVGKVAVTQETPHDVIAMFDRA